MINNKIIRDIWDKELEKAEDFVYEKKLGKNIIENMRLKINSQYEPIMNKYEKEFQRFNEEWFSKDNEEVNKSINDIKNSLQNLKSVSDAGRLYLAKKEIKMENNNQEKINIIEESINKDEISNEENNIESKLKNTNRKFYGFLPKLLTKLKGEEKKEYFKLILNFNSSIPSYADEAKNNIKVYLPKTILPNSFVSDLGEKDISYSIIIDKDESGTFERNPGEEQTGDENEYSKKTILVLSKKKNYILRRNKIEKTISGSELFEHLTQNRKRNLWEWKEKDFEVKVYNEDIIPNDKKNDFFTIRLNKRFSTQFNSKDNKTKFISFPKSLLNLEDNKKDLYIPLSEEDVKSYFYINKEDNMKVSKYSILIDKNKTYSLYDRNKNEYVVNILGKDILENDKDKKITKSLFINSKNNDNQNDLPEDLDNIFDDNPLEQ